MQNFLELMVGGISVGGVYALIAFSFSLLISTTRILNLAHGDFFIWGAAVFVILYSHLGLHPALCLFIFSVFFGLFAFLFQHVIVRPLIHRSPKYLAVGSILTTIGLSITLSATLEFFWVTYISTFPGIALSLSIPSVKLWRASLSGTRLIILFFVIIMVSGLYFFLQKTLLGKRIRAMAHNFDGFLVVGLNPGRLSMIVITIVVLATAISGIFYIIALPLDPYLGLHLTLRAFTVIILAGVGSMPGIFVAGALLGLAEVASSHFWGIMWAPVVNIVILLLILVVKPTGLFGRVEF